MNIYDILLDLESAYYCGFSYYFHSINQSLMSLHVISDLLETLVFQGHTDTDV